MNITKPVRVAHTYTQHLRASADHVVPLLCPVREADWIEGWSPSLVITESGVAERDCMFLTGSGAETAIWVVTEYDPPSGRIEFIKTTPGVTVTRIVIAVRRDTDSTCTADISYQHTALSQVGEAAVSALTAQQFREFMQTWQDRLNHYLGTGEMLRSLEA
ncbi:MAG: hypothetical protein KFH98_14295 [Gemmatimonadetes bacterium]|nr:hypothetical protein [Gemmatimonadota bacterium]